MRARSTVRIRGIVPGLLLLLAGGAACAPASTTPGASGGPVVVDCDEVTPQDTISLVLPAFTPETLAVTPGTTLRFTNDDVVLHAVHSGWVAGSWPVSDGALAADLAPGESVCARFDEEGEHPLFDALYPLDTTALVVVH